MFEVIAVDADGKARTVARNAFTSELSGLLNDLAGSLKRGLILSVVIKNAQPDEPSTTGRQWLPASELEKVPLNTPITVKWRTANGSNCYYNFIKQEHDLYPWLAADHRSDYKSLDYVVGFIYGRHANPMNSLEEPK